MEVVHRRIAVRLKCLRDASTPRCVVNKREAGKLEEESSSSCARILRAVSAVRINEEVGLEEIYRRC